MKKDEGVTPVIATILLVGITVAIAAVVWVFTNQITGEGVEISNLQMSIRDAPEKLDNSLNALFVMRHQGGDCVNTEDWIIRMNGVENGTSFSFENFCIGDEITVTETVNVEPETYEITIVDKERQIFLLSNTIYIH